MTILAAYSFITLCHMVEAKVQTESLADDRMLYTGDMFPDNKQNLHGYYDDLIIFARIPDLII